jgi:hypothetical protein
MTGSYILIKERMMGIAWLAGSIGGLFVLFADFALVLTSAGLILSARIFLTNNKQ